MRAAVFAIALLAPFAALADDCKRVDVFDAWGATRLGPVAAGAMEKAAHPTKDCDLAGQGYCVYRDAAGIDYDVVENFLDSKTLEVAGMPKDASLPFGLSANDSAVQSAAKIKARFGVTLTEQKEVLTSACMLAASGQYYLDVVYLKGKLKSVRVYTDSPRD